MNRRLTVLALLASLLVLLGLTAAPAERRTDGEPFGTAAAPGPPAADPPGVLGSTWYCAFGTALPEGGANMTLVVTNAGADARQGTVTWYPAGAAPVVAPLDIEGLSTALVPAIDAVQAPLVSAVVEVDGGEVVVEHVIGSAAGADAAPCATESSDRWYTANGSTARGAAQVLALFNPFPDDAVVDIRFDTNEGLAEPEATQGVAVPAGTTTIVDLTVTGPLRQDTTAASVIARRGRLIVERVQAFPGQADRGVGLTLAAPAPAEVWTFPEGIYLEGVTERWAVFNPTDEEAIVALEVVPDEGEPPEPLELTVGPGRQYVQLADDTVVPAGVGHSSTIRSLNGVPVVAEREISSNVPGRRGWSSMLGAPSAARRWVLAAGGASEASDEWLMVVNPGSTPVTLRVRGIDDGELVDIDDLASVTLAPAERRQLRVRDAIEAEALSLLVEADGPIVVERDIFSPSIGAIAVLGVPLTE